MKFLPTQKKTPRQRRLTRLPRSRNCHNGKRLCKSAQEFFVTVFGTFSKFLTI